MSADPAAYRFVPGPDADERHAQLVALAEQAAALFPEARGVELYVLRAPGYGEVFVDGAEHLFYAPHYPRPPFVKIEHREPLTTSFKPSGEFAEETP